jgi:hypothetical protein
MVYTADCLGITQYFENGTLSSTCYRAWPHHRRWSVCHRDLRPVNLAFSDAQSSNTLRSMSTGTKTKQPTTGWSAAAQPPQKRQKTGPGEVAILSSNVCGLDQAKWDNIKKMADAHDIDVIAIQEGASKKQVDGLVGPEWQSIVTQEAPFASRIGNETVPPSVGVRRFNVLLKRTSATDISLVECPYTLETSEKFKDKFIGTPVQDPGKRVRKPRINLSELNKLGVRRPQKVELTMPGRDAVSIYNYHAPQGSGSAQGYSGMDAPMGHEILPLVIDEDITPYQMVIGDQNAHSRSMRKHYPTFGILSATTSPTELVHAAIPRGLNPQPIDLGQDAIDFNSKGQPGCSDHPPMAFTVTLPDSV